MPDSGSLRDRDALILEIAGYEGPLDLLLELARRQRVDLREISVLELAEQYLAFVARSEQLRVRLAAEYLLMAVWLAYLKSGLLLPQDEEEGLVGEELAAALAARLERLEAMRNRAQLLMRRPRLGRDVFPRGMPEVAKVTRRSLWDAGLADLITAYARVRTRDCYAPLHLQRPPVIALKEALELLLGNLPAAGHWQSLTGYLPAAWRKQPLLRSALGSLFAGALELARSGEMELHQESPFAAIQVRGRTAGNAGRGAVLASVLPQMSPEETELAA